MNTYILDANNNPIPCASAEAWAWRKANRERVSVAHDIVGDWRVSTVFLTTDHAYGTEPRPLVFETMVFYGGSFRDLDCDRYTTYADAIAGHAAMVEKWRHRVPLLDTKGALGGEL